MDFIYDNTGKPYALKYDGTIYYYVLNLQGDVISIIRHWGESYGSYTYDAWGNVIAQSGSIASINPIRYRGYYYDSETGLYYLGSRYYDPALDGPLPFLDVVVSIWIIATVTSSSTENRDVIAGSFDVESDNTEENEAKIKAPVTDAAESAVRKRPQQKAIYYGIDLYGGIGTIERQR